MYKGLESAKSENLPVAVKMAKQVVCLPIYPDLEKENVDQIIKFIKK